MIKLAIKGIIFLMGIQSFFGRLQNEGIIEGSIKINYSILQEKVISIITSEEFKGLMNKIEETGKNDYSQPEEADTKEYNYDNIKRRSKRCFKHIVRRGETLSNLAEHYGVSWKVIKKVNRISDERRLQIGQNLMIPNLVHSLG